MVGQEEAVGHVHKDPHCRLEFQGSVNVKIEYGASGSWGICMWGAVTHEYPGGRLRFSHVPLSHFYIEL